MRLALLFRGLELGLMKNAKSFFGGTFATYGVLWTFIDSFSFLLLGSKPIEPSLARIIILGLISLFTGAVFARRHMRATIKSNAFSTRITIRFGDLFTEDGLIVIPVNEYFDGLLGDHVSPRSLHGQLISSAFGGNSQRFDECVTTALTGVPFVQQPRLSGNTKKYEIGTVASLPHGAQEFLCVALSATDNASLKANADVPMLWKSLICSLRSARTRSGGRRLVLPLIGGGLSGTGLDPSQLLNLALTAIFEESRRQLVCAEIDIVLHESVFGSVDLAAMKKLWRG